MSNIELECIKAEINYLTTQFPDPEKQGMIAAYSEVGDALASLLDKKTIIPSLTPLLNKWFDRIYAYNEKSITPFETGYLRALKLS